MKRVVKYIFIIVCVVLGSVLIGGGIFYFHALHYTNDSARKNDVAAFEGETYDCLYVTMYSEKEASAYPFEYFMGMKTYKTEHRYDKLRDYTDYMGLILSGESDVREVYSLFEPALVNKAFFCSSTLTRKAYQSTLKEIVTANAEVNFTFLLPVYSHEYWEVLSEKEVNEVLDSYLLFCNEFKDLQNVKIYYFGNREWLVGNPDNYISAENCTEEILNRLVALTFSNDDYRVSGENLIRWITETKVMLEQKKAAPEYNLSEYEIVFFGDSIVGNYSGPLSIPGVVDALSGAETYNCAIGGQSASASVKDGGNGFEQTVSFFLGENKEAFTDKEHFYTETERFCKSEHTGKKLCFVINYGINDYYSGRVVSNTDDTDINTYKGALKAGILRLQKAYPEAEIVLMTPNFVQMFDFGRQVMSKEGDVLVAYVKAGISLAEELEIYYIDNYTSLGIDESNYAQYLEDGTHLNDKGRYEYAGILMEHLTKK